MYQIITQINTKISEAKEILSTQEIAHRSSVWHISTLKLVGSYKIRFNLVKLVGSYKIMTYCIFLFNLAHRSSVLVKLVEIPLPTNFMHEPFDANKKY
jgi:hypothetical protein